MYSNFRDETSLDPPDNYCMVSAHISRSSIPSSHDHLFLARECITHIFLLASTAPKSLLQSARQLRITVTTIPLPSPLSPTDAAAATAAVVLLLGKLAEAPADARVLIAGEGSGDRPGVVVGILRRLMGWSLAAVLAEYDVACEGRPRTAWANFIENFDLSLLDDVLDNGVRDLMSFA